MKKIMIVDDEKYIRKSIIGRMNWKNLNLCVVAEAGNGEEALRLMSQEEPDLVLVDIRMPKMDGLAFIGEAKKRFSKAKYIIMSAYSDFDYARKAIQLGVEDYILKPVDEEEFQEVIEKLSDREKEPVEDWEKQGELATAVKQYVQRNFARDLSTSKLADEFFVNANYLSTLFKKKEGINLTRYIEEVRMERAKELLKGNKSITSIAAETGYMDSGYFSRIFKKYVGMSPRQYRNQL